MTTAERELITLVLQLPPGLQSEVRNYAEFLLHKQHSQGAPEVPAAASRTLGQDWAGALAPLKEQYDSVALQHQAAHWMGEDARRTTGDDVSA